MFPFLLGSTGLFPNTVAGRAGRVEHMFKSLAPALAVWRVKSQPLENHTVHTQQKSEKPDRGGEIKTSPPAFLTKGSLYPDSNLQAPTQHDDSAASPLCA